MEGIVCDSDIRVIDEAPAAYKDLTQARALPESGWKITLLACLPCQTPPIIHLVGKTPIACEKRRWDRVRPLVQTLCAMSVLSYPGASPLSRCAVGLEC